MEEKRLIALVNQAQEGKTEAFSELYAEHARLILFNVRNLLYDKESYDDVAQEIGVKLYERLGSLNEPAAFKGWMYTIIRTVCVDHNRKYLRGLERQSLDDDEEYLETIEDESRDIDPAAAWDDALEENQIYRALAQLSAMHREVLIMRYYDDLSYKEIAGVLGTSVNNVSARLHRATKAARQLMSNNIYKEREGAFVEDDPQTKNSITAAATVLVPTSVVEQNVAAVSSKVAALTVASAPVAAVAATTKLAFSKLVTIASLIVLAVAAVGVYAGITWYSQEPVEESAVVTTVHEYQGNPKIVFSDTKGEDTQNSIKSIRLVEDTVPVASVSYEIVSEGGAVVLSNTQAEISEAELTELAPGMYDVIFTVLDEHGARIDVTRSFSIE